MKRGEVWQVNLDPTIGAEINKSRPCVIVNQDALASLALKIIVPITAWRKEFDSADWHVKIYPSQINGLQKESSADTFQVRSISQKRLVRKYGTLDTSVMKEVDKALSISLNLDK